MPIPVFRRWALTFHWHILRGLVWFQFTILFPLAIHLSLPLARRVAGCFGWLCYRLDLDWRTVSLRQHFVRDRTRMAVASILPGASKEEIEHLVRRRFVTSAHEELEGHYFSAVLPPLFTCRFVGLEAVRETMTRRGIVFLTLHFDATLMGVKELGRAGLVLNLMTSNIVEDARVPPEVRRYFANKYSGIERSLNGGHVMHNETHMREFYRALGRNEGVVVLCEAPATRPEEGLKIDFLGKLRSISPGGLRLAEKSGSAVAGFVCRRTANGGFELLFSPVVEPTDVAGMRDSIVAVYRFLEAEILRSPDLWWAADLLPAYADLDAG